MPMDNSSWDFSSYYPKTKKCLPMQESEVFNTIFAVTILCFGNFLKEKYVLLQVVKLAGNVAKTWSPLVCQMVMEPGLMLIHSWIILKLLYNGS